MLATLRSLSRSPGFTLTAVLTLAVGLAGALSLAAVVHGVVLRPLPYRDPDRLAAVTSSLEKRSWNILGEVDARDLAEGNPACQEIVLLAQNRASELEGTFGTALLSGVTCDWNLLEVLGTRPALGRFFTREEGPNSVVLSHEVWVRNLNSDPAAVGRTLTLDGKPRRVIGVMEPGFRLPMVERNDYLEILDRTKGARGNRQFRGIARLSPGATLAQLQGSFAVRSRSLGEAFPDNNRNWSFGAMEMKRFLLGDTRESLLFMLGLASLLLLLACLNVASLFLTRALGRRPELALRTALGASFLELFRQHVLEGVVVGLPGAVAGLGAAWLVLSKLSLLFPDLPGTSGLRPTLWELLAALALVGTTSLGFALLPLRQVRDPRLTASLQAGTRGATAGGRRARAVLVAGESALSVVLLVLGGLFLASSLRALRRDPGYRTRDMAVLQVTLPRRRFPNPQSRLAFQGALDQNLKSLPGVREVALASGLPCGLGDHLGTDASAVPPEKPRSEWPNIVVASVSPSFFRTSGIPLKAGRAFTAGDRLGSPFVAILSAQCARRLFPGGSPIGRSITTGLGIEGIADGLTMEVVGVCGDVVDGDLRSEPEFTVYASLGQVPLSSTVVLLQSSLPLATLRPLLEARLKTLDPAMPIREFTTVETILHGQLQDLTRTTGLLGLFGLVGLALALLGVGSVVSVQVAMRRREFGVRMALGAGIGRIRTGVMTQGLAPVAIGAAGGLGLAMLLARVVASRLYGTPPTDPTIIGATLVLYGFAGAMASFVPAIRATRVNPAEALRAE